MINLDWGILHWIQSSMKCQFLDFLMPKITLLGDKGFIWLAAAALLVCTKKYRKQGVILFCGIAAGALLGNIVLKPLIARPRPCWLDANTVLLVANPTDFSFPSGHTLASAIGAAILTKTDRRFGWAAIPLAIGIAFSRLYLYVHFPSDVFAAALLGIPLGAAAYRIGMQAPFIKIRQKK